MTRTVGVVIPAYRPDVDVLLSYLEELEATLSPAAIRIELDDPDPTALEALAGTSAALNVAESRRGKGRAITCGFEALETDVLAFADADGSTPAASLAAVVESVDGSVAEPTTDSRGQDGAASLAVGSRRHPAATIRAHQSIVRRRLGDWFALVAGRLLEPTLYDYQCGAKAIDRAAWEAVFTHLEAVGFGWDIELIALAHALGYRIEEVPITWEDDPRSTVGTVRGGYELVRALARSRRRAASIRRRGAAEPSDGRRGRPSVFDGLDAEADADAGTTDE